MAQRDAIAGKAQWALSIPAATVVTLNVPERGNFAFINFESGSVRATDDGTAPSATVGHLFSAGAFWEYDGQPQDLKFFSAAGATINVSYYG